MNDIASFGNAFLLVYAALFPIVNPVGNAPIFLRLTQPYPEAQRRSLAAGVATSSFILLISSLLIGSHVLVFFGLTLEIVRIAGGTVVAALGWRLLHANEELEDQRSASDNTPGVAIDAFYPLTMPLTVGPGSISVAIALGSQRPANTDAWPSLVALASGALAGIAAISLSIYLSYRYAGSIVRALGKSGTNVLTRLSAFILFCIGIQVVWTGVLTLAKSLR